MIRHGNNFCIIKEVSTAKTEETKTEIPIKIETPIVQKTESVSVAETPKVENIKAEELKIEDPKVWTPMKIPVREDNEWANDLGEKKIERPSPMRSINKMADLVKPKENDKKEELIPELSQKPEKNSFGYPINNNLQNNLMSEEKKGDEVKPTENWSSKSSFLSELMSVELTRRKGVW